MEKVFLYLYQNEELLLKQLGSIDELVVGDFMLWTALKKLQK